MTAKRTLLIDVCDWESAMAKTVASLEAAKRGELQDASTYSFPNTNDLLDTLSAKRWDVLRALIGGQETGVRELARSLGRDVHAVHRDAEILVGCGLIEKSCAGKLVFPYDEVRVALLMQAA